MLKIVSKQLSFHSLLYTKIPENHILKSILKVVDFSFINQMLAKTYCKNLGRPAKEPELMCKLLFLQHLYNLSDERVIQEASLNLAYLYFLGLNPEDSLPNKSLLAKFRCHRLEKVTLDAIITEIVRQCVEKGIIKSDSVSIDATHIEANTRKAIPERILKQLSKKIVKVFETESKIALEDVEEIPDYTLIDDPKEAKDVMKEHLTHVIETVEAKDLEDVPQTKKVIQQAKDILKDPKFIVQKGLRSLVDQEARVGRKSRHESFYGYKAEFTMTTDENIITAVKTFDGAYVDGSYTKEMLNTTRQSGMIINEVYGDKAYFRKPILDTIAELEAKAYIPVSEQVYRIDESKFNYNKDADEWICHQGNRTVNKKLFGNKGNQKKAPYYKYYFEMQQCKQCPNHNTCAKKQARKILEMRIHTPEFYEISQEQKQKKFLEKYKKRASIESKNAELKRFHGLYRARGYGLESVSKQTKLATIAVNLKRIVAITAA